MNRAAVLQTTETEACHDPRKWHSKHSLKKGPSGDRCKTTWPGHGQTEHPSNIEDLPRTHWSLDVSTPLWNSQSSQFFFRSPAVRSDYKDYLLFSCFLSKCRTEKRLPEAVLMGRLCSPTYARRRWITPNLWRDWKIIDLAPLWCENVLIKLMLLPSSPSHTIVSLSCRLTACIHPIHKLQPRNKDFFDTRDSIYHANKVRHAYRYSCPWRRLYPR